MLTVWGILNAHENRHGECYKLPLYMYMADLNVPSGHSLTVTQIAWQRLMLNSTYLEIIKMENTMFNLFNTSFRGNIIIISLTNLKKT